MKILKEYILKQQKNGEDSIKKYFPTEKTEQEKQIAIQNYLNSTNKSLPQKVIIGYKVVGNKAIQYLHYQVQLDNSFILVIWDDDLNASVRVCPAGQDELEAICVQDDDFEYDENQTFQESWNIKIKDDDASPYNIHIYRYDYDIIN